MPSRRGLTVLGAALLTLPLLTVPASAAPVAAAVPSVAVLPAAETPEEARERERQAMADLAESSEEVRAAAVALNEVAAELPRAQTDVARARGELAGARAKVAAANAVVARAEAAREAAEKQVDEADGRVEQSREDVGQLARRAYQQGRLGDLREVMEAGEPQDVLERASLLRSVFKHQDESLTRLTSDRLELARTQAGLAAEERSVARARARAQDGESRARTITVEAESAASRVAALVDQREGALEAAEDHRADDEREYQQAQAASRALAERIREAARQAAAAEAQRQATAKAAAAAAARRAAAAGRPAPPPAVAAPRTSGRTGSMRWPCSGCPQTSSFGWRTHPIFGSRRFHAGIDMGAPIGKSVLAADGGTVTYAGSASGYGTLVVVSHGLVGGRDLSTAYAHMSTISVRPGQRVGRGTKVGEVGNEGNSTGPHLHFEVRSDGNPVNPRNYVSP